MKIKLNNKKMKIQIDDSKKTITLDNGVNMGEFFKKIKVIVPDWEEWSLETNTVISNWGNPIYIDRYPYQYPWVNNPIYTGGSDIIGCVTTNDSTEHIFNIEA